MKKKILDEKKLEKVNGGRHSSTQNCAYCGKPIESGEEQEHNGQYYHSSCLHEMLHHR